MTFRLNNYDNFFINQTSVNGGIGGCCNGGGNNFGNMLLQGLGMGVNIFAAAQMAKASNTQSTQNVKGAFSEYSGAVASRISNYANESTQAIAEFTSKYGADPLNMSISEDGTVTPSYESVSNQIDEAIKNIKSDSNVTKAGKSNLQSYSKLQAKYTGLSAAASNYDQTLTNLSSFKSTNSVGVKYTGDGEGSSAEAVPLGSGDYENYVQYLDPSLQQIYTNSKDISKVKSNIEALPQWTSENQNRTRNAKLYNDQAKNLSSILTKQGVKTRTELQTKVDAAKTEMDNYANNNKVNDSDTISSYNSQIEGLEAKKAKLGSKTDFDKAVNTVKNLYEQHKNDLALQKKEQSYQSSENAVTYNSTQLKAAKRGGKKGLAGWFYDFTHKDSKDEKVLAQKAKYNTAVRNFSGQNFALYSAYNEHQAQEQDLYKKTQS